MVHQGSAGLFVLAALAFVFGSAEPLPELPQLNIDVANISVSGVSAGGAFALQYHVSHSSQIMGVALFAAPPFYCALANVDIALSSCMKEPNLISLDSLFEATTYAFATNTIDDPKLLAHDKVWVFTGNNDTVVVPGVVQKTVDYYRHYVADPELIIRNAFPAEHAWITQGYGNDCGYLGDPYINNCGFDAANDMLTHFYGDLAPPSAHNASNLFRFGQEHYVVTGTPTLISMGDIGYAYIPQQCASGARLCKLHVAFHGCNQDIETIGQGFVEHTGLNPYAETNDIVILYPQVRKSQVTPYNPKGCFDWWGYTGLDYSCKLGPQLQAVTRMIVQLSNGKFSP